MASKGNLKFLTYNIDGLNPVNLQYRTRTALGFIMSENPDIIQLQEVVVETAQLITSTLTRNGYASCENLNNVSGMFHYFTLTFVKANKFEACSVQRVNYTGRASSQQGRDSLQLRLRYMGLQWLFINCHLESCGAPFKSVGSAIRMSQLTNGLNEISMHECKGPAVLAGDLNIRDPEANRIMQQFSTNIYDASDVMERKKSNTWFIPGPSKYSARYDRVYFNSASALAPKYFKIIGGEDVYSGEEGGFGAELPYRTASDHRGICVEFEFSASTDAVGISNNNCKLSSSVEGLAYTRDISSEVRSGNPRRSGSSSKWCADSGIDGASWRRKVPVGAEVICLDDSDDDNVKAPVSKSSTGTVSGPFANSSAGSQVQTSIFRLGSDNPFSLQPSPGIQQTDSSNQGNQVSQTFINLGDSREVNGGVDRQDHTRQRRELMLRAAESRAK